MSTIRVALALLLLLTSWSALGSAATSSNQWFAYGRDDSQQRYTPSTQINTDSVRKLGLKWSLPLPNETSLVSTPLMVDDTLYFTGKFSVVYAVSARTGSIKWVFDAKSREVLAKGPRRMVQNWGTSRGVAYWRGTILVAAVDGRLISLSAQTGKPLWSTQTLDPASRLYISGPPLVFGDKVLIGNGGGDYDATRGYVTAYSAKTGQQLWRFYTVPGDPATETGGPAMQRAAKTWGRDWWKTSGGGNVWNAMTFDRDLNRIYIGTGNGSPWNHAIAGRSGGDNLYVCSIIALDADTGQYVWHYQLVPGDNWDYDAAEDLVLANLEIAGVARKALIHASKNGFFYVIDRATGRLISAEKFAHVTWADHIDLATGRPVEPDPSLRPVGAHSKIVTLWPWTNGAHSWPPMSFNPNTGLAYIPGQDVSQTLDARGIDPNHYQADRVEQWIGYSDLAGRDPDPKALAPDPNPVPQTAWLQARDPRTNTRVWQVNQPGLFAGGTLTTAGGLVFIGQATGDLVAYDARTGAPLWKFNCGRPIDAPPISYVVDGVQYVAVLVGWGGVPATEGGLSAKQWQMQYRDGGRGLFVFALGGTGVIAVSPIVPAKPVDVPAFVPDEAKVKRGQYLFDNNCNLCHGTNAVNAGHAPDLRASYAATDQTVLRAIVLDGALLLKGMPQYVDFNNDDVEALYHYIRWRARKDLRQ